MIARALRYTSIDPTGGEAMPLEQPFKLGKQEAEPRDTDFEFSDFAASIRLPTTPSRFGHENAYDDWRMLGNDRYGDCVWAGAAHEHMLLNKVVHGRDLAFTDDSVLNDYAAATGFDRNDPSTDRGTNVHDSLSYRRKTGIADAGGGRHRIGAYVSLEPTNWEHLEQAAYIFGAVGIGFRFPDSAMRQFANGEPWSPVRSATIEGGHYVPVVGSLHAATEACAITWGKQQVFTVAFYEQYNDEAWAYITNEELRGDGTGLHGFDIEKLNAYLAAVGNSSAGP
jgi:hypothetical protein